MTPIRNAVVLCASAGPGAAAFKRATASIANINRANLAITFPPLSIVLEPDPL